ncbi:hypothetical protein TNCV_4679641 [Trichonephila clavipes]|nr:hypothetical protein TNCV_4679641 [Trichonephila clavipes]
MARSVPHSRSGSPHRSQAVVQHWISRYGTSSTNSIRKKFPLCGIEGAVNYSELTDQDHTFAPIRWHGGRCFGRDLRLPCDLLFGRPPDTPSSPESTSE